MLIRLNPIINDRLQKTDNIEKDCYIFTNIKNKSEILLRLSSVYLHGTPAQLDHFKQHHVFHAIFLVVAIYPTRSLDCLSFLPCRLLPLLSTLNKSVTINETSKLLKIF